jgi:hypothetical protein
MKTILIYTMAAWTIWAGYAMLTAGHTFGVLLPIAGGLLVAATASRK